MKQLLAAIALTITFASCLTPRETGAGIGAFIGAHEGGVGGAALGALAGYGAGALIEESARAHPRARAPYSCHRCPPRRRCLGH